MNEITLIGRLSGHLSYYCTERGQDLLRFRLATDRLPMDNRVVYAAVGKELDELQEMAGGVAGFHTPLETAFAGNPPRTHAGAPRYRRSRRGRAGTPPQADATHACEAWGPAALDLHEHLHAADRLLVRGELTYRHYQTPGGELIRRSVVLVKSYGYLGTR